VGDAVLGKRHWEKDKVTGKNMWDFVQTYWTPLGGLLCEIEEKGMYLDRQHLKRIEHEAAMGTQSHQDAFVRWAQSFEGSDRQPLNPRADCINIISAMQIRQFLYGDPDCPPEDQQMNLKTSEILNPSSSFQAPNTRQEVAEGKIRATKNISFTITGIGLKVKAGKKSKAAWTETGWPKTSQQILRWFAGEPFRNPPLLGEAFHQLELKIGPERAFEACKGLWHLREAVRARRLLSSYIRPLQAKADDEGRIHSSLLPDTATGRLVSRRPNLQNQPSKNNDIYGVRRAFKAPEGHRLVVADYSQLELRVLAHASSCPFLIDKFQQGADLHSETAIEMFEHVRMAVEKGEVCDRNAEGGGALDGRPSVKDRFRYERSVAKMINFSIAYGKGPAALADDLGCKYVEAQDFLDRWYQQKTEVQLWKERMVREARFTNESRSLLGRVRKLPFINHKCARFREKSERAAVNHVIQGSAADLVMAAMLRLRDHPALKQMGYTLIMQVHDEFLLEGPEAHAAAACEIVLDVMRHPFPRYGLSVPLEVDARVAETWYEAKGGAPMATITPTPTPTATKEEQNSGSEAAPVPPANLNGNRVWLNGATHTTHEEEVEEQIEALHGHQLEDDIVLATAEARA